MAVQTENTIHMKRFGNSPTLCVIVYCILSFFLSLNQLTGQCTFSEPLIIPDNGTATIFFHVSGLANPNLSSPTQGICGVEIDFMHEYLGDLTITLISPSGTIVTLIGPSTITTGITNLTRWNIDFVPCGTPAAPDAGFTPLWSNLQAWQSITPYSGTYHPHIGCLENFNSGSANGLWQLVLQDHDEFQTGMVASAALIFCDPLGLDCTECAPNGGTLSPSTLTVCSGESVQSSSISIDFGGNIPPAALYSYEYILVSGNSILQSGSAFSATPPAGNYSICGISYATVDQASLNNLLSAGDLDLLEQALDAGIVCGQLTTNCLALTVLARPDTTQIGTTLCQGEQFVFRGQTYSTTGLFFLVIDGPGLCDTVYEISINPRPLSVTIDPPGMISCGQGSIPLSSTGTGAAGPFTYQWTTTTGNITSPSTTPVIMVNQPGQYFVQITDGLCSGNGSVIVLADQGYPQVLVTGGTLSCTNPTLDIHPVFVPSNASVSWTGPSGFSASTADINVTLPGQYTIAVTNLNGCTTTRILDIGIDTATVDMSIIPLGKNCQNMTLELGVSLQAVVRSWLWTGPNGFISTAARPFISDAGLYMLTATYANGCQRNFTYLFDGDFALPDMMMSPGDTLNCNEIITLSVSSMTSGALFAWNGPLGYYGSQPSIQVIEPGFYRATVNAPNGCRNSQVVEIVLGDDIFDYTTFTDTINCATDTVQIGILSPEADLFEWLNYTGPDTGLASIRVGVAGVYTVMVTDTHSGCEILVDIRVAQDFAVPSFDYRSDTISCLNPVAELQFIPLAGFSYSNVYWELPDMTTVPGPTLMSDLPGEHRLVGVGENGCIGIWRIQIPFDTLRPYVITETDTLICQDTVQIRFESLDPVVSYDWSGPGIIALGVREVSVTEAGYYQLTVTGANGCAAITELLVDSNYVQPVFSIVTDSLRCDRPATVSVVSADGGLTYIWTDEFNQILSTDSTLEVVLPGIYVVEVRGPNQCSAFDSIMFGPLVYSAVEAISDVITCRTNSAEISATTSTSNFEIYWIDQAGDTIGTNSILTVSSPGPFIVSILNSFGCESRDTITVPFDTISPVASIQLVGEVRCQLRDIRLDGTSSFPSGLSYAWSSIGGSILSDPVLPMINAYDTGIYFLVVERMDNGCKDTASYHVTESPDALRSIEADIRPAACSGDHNAGIEVTGFMGGVGPFLFRLNNGPVQAAPVFGGLSPGIYLLQITDAEGCEYDTTILIEPTLPFTVDAGPDLEIFLGESILLTGMTDLPVSGMLRDQWDSLGIVLCDPCMSVDVAPWETSAYTYTVISVTGCVRSDQVTVFVVEKPRYFIPNVFTPNGDGINDEVRIFHSSGIEKVLRWIIFDRWGNAVYGKTNFEPDDPSVFWDGRATTGEFTNPGVFPYLLELEMINGRKGIFRGDITLIR